jgi:myo-inositol-1(or 4)-monophosphatase
VSELLDLARTIAVEAAEFAAARRDEGVSVAATKSSITDVVTQVDRDTEDLIRALIAKARPRDGFFGEEGAATPGESGITWVVDPIDGTVNFLYDIPQWAVSIGVVEGEPDPQTWRALASAVVNPRLGEVYSAENGAGAFLGDRRLEVPPAPAIEQALVATGFFYDSATRAHQGAVVAELLPLVRDIRRMGAGSLDIISVATGRVNAYFETHLSPWDHAGAALIASEAGAAVIGKDGRRPDRDRIVAGPRELVDWLTAFLDEHGY